MKTDELINMLGTNIEPVKGEQLRNTFHCTGGRRDSSVLPDAGDSRCTGRRARRRVLRNQSRATFK